MNDSSRVKTKVFLVPPMLDDGSTLRLFSSRSLCVLLCEARATRFQFHSRQSLLLKASIDRATSLHRHKREESVLPILPQPIQCATGIDIHQAPCLCAPNPYLQRPLARNTLFLPAGSHLRKDRINLHISTTSTFISSYLALPYYDSQARD